jgi:hypothetical protein
MTADDGDESNRARLRSRRWFGRDGNADSGQGLLLPLLLRGSPNALSFGRRAELVNR